MCLHCNDQHALKQVWEQWPSMVSYKDRNLRFTFVNTKWCEEFNLRSEDVLGKTLSEVWSGSSKDYVHQYNRDDLTAISTGNPVENVVHAYFKNGQMKYCIDNIIPFGSVDGSCDTIMSISTDITDWLKKSKQLELIISNTTDMIIVFDRTGIYREIYPGLVTPATNIESMLGKSVYEVFSQYPNIVEAFKKAMHDLTEHKMTIMNYELDGHNYEAILSWFNATGILCFVRNITGRLKQDPLDALADRINNL